jgi:MFS family permease
MVDPEYIYSRKKRVFSVLFLAIFSSMLGIGIIVPLLPIYAEDLGAKGLSIGIIFSGFSLTRAIFSPVAGRISDRWGRKIPIAMGLLFYGIVSICYIFSTTVIDLILIRFAQGFSAAFIIPLAMAYIGEISPSGKEGSYIGLFTVSLFAGFGFGPILGGALMDRIGIISNFYTMSGLCLIAFILVVIWLPELHYEEKEIKWEINKSYFDLLRNPVVIGLFLYRFTMAYCRGILMTFLPLFAHDSIGMSGFEVGIVISANVLLNSFLQAPSGRLADRYDRKRLIFFGALSFIISLFLITHTLTFLQVFIISIAMGISGAVSLPAASAIAIQEGKRYGMGTVMGIYDMGMSIGLVFGPVTGGLIADLIGIRGAFYSGGLIGITGTISFIALLQRGSNP